MRLLPLAAAVVGLAGCGGPDRVPVHPVAGTLLVGGRPAANAHVVFHPTDGAVAVRPVAVTGPDGVYRLTTFAAGDGAPAGGYVVTVFWPADTMPADPCDCPDPSAHDRLRGAYLDPARSPLRAAVVPGENRVELRAEVGAEGWNLPRRGR
jgi:hypothetical protein